ncbi:MAG: porin [Polyangiales bacterium]
MPEAPAAKPEEPPLPLFAAAPGKGLVVTTRDKLFQIGLRPRIQLRTQLNHREVGPDELEVQVRTLRLTINGYALTPDLKYTIQFAFGGGDFDNGVASPIFDAFIEYTRIRDFNIRVGQYFVPFDRARTIREFALHFVDRQQVVRELTLDRDVGIMFSSADIGGLGGRLAYNVFLGGGDGRNRFADTKNAYGPQRPGFLAVGRLTVRPFGPFDDDQEGDITRTKTPKLAIGVAGGYNRSATRQRSTTGDTYTAGAYDYQHAAADLVFKLRGFALLAETVWRGADRESHARLDTATNKTVTEYSREGWGWFVQAGQMLTSRLEVVGRFEELHAKKGTDPALVRATAGNAGRQTGGGLNLYLNGHAFKLQTDYIYVFADPSKNAQHLARLQLDATF